MENILLFNISLNPIFHLFALSKVLQIFSFYFCRLFVSVIIELWKESAIKLFQRLTFSDHRLAWITFMNKLKYSLSSRLLGRVYSIYCFLRRRCLFIVRFSPICLIRNSSCMSWKVIITSMRVICTHFLFRLLNF